MEQPSQEKASPLDELCKILDEHPYNVSMNPERLAANDGKFPARINLLEPYEQSKAILGQRRHLVYVPEQTIATTVGAETCGVDVLNTANCASYECCEYIMHCKHCQHEYGYVQYNEDGDVWMDEPPKFCPNCGRRIEAKE